MKNKKNIYFAGILLLVGFTIYATCRQDVLVFLLNRFENETMAKLLDFIRIDVSHESLNIFTCFLIFGLPDVLWYFALLLLQQQLYNHSKSSLLLLCVAIVLPFVLEIMQYFGLAVGTFDIVDVCSYVFTLIIFMVLWKTKRI